MLKRLLIILAVFTALFVAIGLWLPTQQRVERSILVKRSAADVFTVLNGFQRGEEWLPWIRRDPVAEIRISGQVAGPGKRVSWHGDPRLVGAGALEILASKPFERIDLRLDLDGQGSAGLVFQLVQNPTSIEVTWVFLMDFAEGRGFFDTLLGRYLGLFLGNWVGAELEDGLEHFRQLVESLPPMLVGSTDIEIVTVESRPILFVASHSSQGAEDSAAALSMAFTEISAFLEAYGIDVDGQPMAITRAWDETGYQFDAAVPFKGDLPPLTGRLKTGLSPGGQAVRIIHRGAYEEILETYEKLAAFMAARGLTGAGVSWEHYVTDPTETTAADLVTHVFVQLEE